VNVDRPREQDTIESPMAADDEEVPSTSGVKFSFNDDPKQGSKRRTRENVGVSFADHDQDDDEDNDEGNEINRHHMAKTTEKQHITSFDGRANGKGQAPAAVKKLTIPSVCS
jgi:hypothetical protein